MALPRNRNPASALDRGRDSLHEISGQDNGDKIAVSAFSGSPLTKELNEFVDEQ